MLLTRPENPAFTDYAWQTRVTVRMKSTLPQDELGMNHRKKERP